MVFKYFLSWTIAATILTTNKKKLCSLCEIIISHRQQRAEIRVLFMLQGVIPLRMMIIVNF